METFKVEAVIDGNTFEISPDWEFRGETGNRVQAKGYTAPKSGKEAMAVEQRLSGLIQNKKVVLESPDGIERGRLICDVYYEGINIAEHFAEHKERVIEEMETEQGEKTDIYNEEEIDTEESEQEEKSEKSDPYL